MDRNGCRLSRYFLGAEEPHKEPPLRQSVSGTSSIPQFPEYEGGCLLAVVLEEFKVATQPQDAVEVAAGGVPTAEQRTVPCSAHGGLQQTRRRYCHVSPRLLVKVRLIKMDENLRSQ